MTAEQTGRLGEGRTGQLGQGPESARLMRRATYASVAVAAVLVVAKFAAWVVTGSVAVLTSMVDSMLDVAASAVNVFAVAHSLEPADSEHRFGHGKAEAVAALIQAAVIAGSAVFLLFEAGERAVHPVAIGNSMIGIAVIAGSVVVTGLLVLFQKYVVRRTGSMAIAADSLHYVSDLLTGLGVIAALILASSFGFLLADPVFAIAIAGYILWSARRIALKALDQIMDRELPDSDRAHIRHVVLSHSDVLDMHDLRTRVSGSQVFIQLHLELDGGLTLDQAHIIADEAEVMLIEAFPGAEVLIHQDPEGINDQKDFH